MPLLSMTSKQTNKKFSAYLVLQPYLRFIITFVFVLFCDQFSKWLVGRNIPIETYHNPPPIPIIHNFLYLVHIGNPGAAWGILKDNSLWLAILGVGFVIAVYCFRKDLNLKNNAMQYAFGMLCGGVMGNVFDRFFHGYVIDFIDVHLPGYRFPAFNIADMGISIGVALYLWFQFLPLISKTSKN